jgi:hypothetical protein
MDPKSVKNTPEQILQHIDAKVQALNMHALAHYAALLKTCGVRRPQIYRAFFLP